MGSCMSSGVFGLSEGRHAVDARVQEEFARKDWLKYELIVSQWMLGANQEMVELSLFL